VAALLARLCDRRQQDRIAGGIVHQHTFGRRFEWHRRRVQTIDAAPSLAIRSVRVWRVNPS
jgi:hypothetical protein